MEQLISRPNKVNVAPGGKYFSLLLLMITLSCFLWGCAPALSVACEENATCDTTVKVESVQWGLSAENPNFIGFQFAPIKPENIVSNTLEVGDPIYITVDWYRLFPQSCEGQTTCSRTPYIERNIYAVDSTFLQQPDGSNLDSFTLYLSSTPMSVLLPDETVPATETMVPLLAMSEAQDSALYSAVLSGMHGVTVDVMAQLSSIPKPIVCEPSDPEADCVKMIAIQVGP